MGTESTRVKATATLARWAAWASRVMEARVTDSKEKASTEGATEEEVPTTSTAEVTNLQGRFLVRGDREMWRGRDDDDM